MRKNWKISGVLILGIVLVMSGCKETEKETETTKVEQSGLV